MGQDYIDLVELVRGKLNRTERWSKLVLMGRDASLKKFLSWFKPGITNPDEEANIIEQRDLRFKLLLCCPEDLLSEVLSLSDRYKSQPTAWEGFVYSPFELAMRGSGSGFDVDVTKLTDAQVVRCTIIKMTCMPRSAV